MTIHEALRLFSGAQVAHPTVPPRKLQIALLTILSAARREADRQAAELSDMDREDSGLIIEE